MLGIRRNSTNVRGTIRAFNIRSEKEGTLRGQRDIFVWSFRLEQHDADGSPLLLMPVELRGHTIEGGRPNDGDEVAVVGSIRNGTLIARSIVDVQTGSVVRPTGRAFNQTTNILGLLAILIFGSVTLLTNTSLLPALLAQFAVWGSTTLQDCYVYLPGPGPLNSLPLEAGSNMGLIENAGRYAVIRRADSVFGTKRDYEMQVGNLRGWVSSAYVRRFEGDCNRQAARDRFDPVPTDDPTACYVFANQNFMYGSPDPQDMEMQLPTFSRLRAFQTSPSSLGEMVEVEYDGRRLWLPKPVILNPEGNCGWLLYTPTPAPTSMLIVTPTDGAPGSWNPSEDFPITPTPLAVGNF